MRTFILLGVSLLVGFTFADNVPGKHQSVSLNPRVTNASTDVVQAAYQSAQRAVAGRVGVARSPKFPGRGFYRTHVSRQADGTFAIRSWVITRGVLEMEARHPWTARVRCEGASCRVLDFDLLGT